MVTTTKRETVKLGCASQATTVTPFALCISLQVNPQVGQLNLLRVRVNTLVIRRASRDTLRRVSPQFIKAIIERPLLRRFRQFSDPNVYRSEPFVERVLLHIADHTCLT